jgi:hypothetical protein
VRSSAIAAPTATTAVVAAARVSASVSTAITIALAVAIAAPAIVATVVIAASVVATPVIPVSVVAVIPGAGTDKHAAYEVTRPVIAIGRAVIGIVVVVAVGTDRGRAVVPVVVVVGGVNRTAYSDAYGDLGGRAGRYSDKQYPQQCKGL